MMHAPPVTAPRRPRGATAWSVLTVVLVCSVLCRCGTSTTPVGGPPSSTTVGPPSSVTVGTPVTRPTDTPDDIAAADTSPGNTVVLDAGGGPSTISGAEQTPMPSGSDVSSSGGAVAEMTFAKTSACALQAVGAVEGLATTRVPPPALLELTQGMVTCTIVSIAVQLHVCGQGVISANSSDQPGTQFDVTCDPDPMFAVAVLNGSLRVSDTGGTTRVVTAGQQFTCDSARLCPSPISSANFTPRQLGLFRSQAARLVFRAPPTSTTTVATCPPRSESCQNPTNVVVPNVVGDSLPDAEAQLARVNLSYTKVLGAVGDPSQDNLIVATDPPAGSTALEGTQITLTVGRYVSPGPSTS